MTLTSSRISDEFKLVQEILAKSPGFDVPFMLYPNLALSVSKCGEVLVAERTHREATCANMQLFTTRQAARYILRRYW